MFVHADIETLLKITHWRSSVCHPSGAFSNAAWLVLHCVTTQNGGTAASGGWLQTALHWPCDSLQQRWPAKLVSLACRATWSVLISSIRLLRIRKHSENNSYWSYKFSCGNTPTTCSEMGVWWHTHRRRSRAVASCCVRKKPWGRVVTRATINCCQMLRILLCVCLMESTQCKNAVMHCWFYNLETIAALRHYALSTNC